MSGAPACATSDKMARPLLVVPALDLPETGALQDLEAIRIELGGPLDRLFGAARVTLGRQHVRQNLQGTGALGSQGHGRARMCERLVRGSLLAGHAIQSVLLEIGACQHRPARRETRENRRSSARGTAR